jgi:ABC-type Mn2+/Zn2+ transport system permease subunit
VSWFDSYLHRAVLEAAVVGALAGVIGVQVVLRRLAFFSLAMTHATFPGVVLAAVLGANIYLGGALTGVLVCLGVVALSRRRGQSANTATGVVLSAGFALGVALMSAQAGFSRDLSAFLVGSILTVDTGDVLTTAAIGMLVVAVLLVLSKELLFGAFDPAGLRAVGYPAAALDLLVLLLVEAVIVAAVPAVGTILTIALIVGPALTARLWTDRLGLTTALAAVFGVVSGLAGLAVSERFNIAAGGAITLAATLLFLLSLLVSPRHGALRRLLPRIADPRSTTADV